MKTLTQIAIVTLLLFIGLGFYSGYKSGWVMCNDSHTC